MGRDRKRLNTLLVAGAALAALAYPLAGWAEAPLNLIPLPPSDPPPPHGPILIYALYNWIILAVVLGLLVREAWRTKSALPLAFIVGGALAGIVEPVFDGNIHVLFVHPPGDAPSWTVYNVPYPWYVIPGNALLAGPCYWMYHKFRTGISTRALWIYFFVWWVFDGIQEMPGTTMGAYVYYGPQPFVVSNWPVWIGMLASLGFPLTGYFAYTMRDILSGARLWWAVVIVMPVTIYGCEVIAWPMWDTLNMAQSLLVTHLAAILSLVFTATAYYALVLAYQRRRTATTIGTRVAAG